MRVIEDRYRRDWRRHDIAWRLIQLNARSGTIGFWSGLSRYRVRQLSSQYGVIRSEVDGIRGASPRQIAFFWRSARVKTEAAVLAGFLYSFGVLPHDYHENPTELSPSLALGELLCRAVEQFLSLLPETAVTIEHAVLLLAEMMRGTEVALGTCPRCRGLILIDRLAADESLCAGCAHEAQAGHSFRLIKRDDLPLSSEVTDDEELQRSLF